MAGAAVLSPARPGLLPTLTARFGGGRWRPWVAVAFAFNLALGMGSSVVVLHHQADARAQTDVLLAELDAASAQEATLWRAVAYGQSSDEVQRVARRMERAARQASASPLTRQDQRIRCTARQRSRTSGRPEAVTSSPRFHRPR